MIKINLANRKTAAYLEGGPKKKGLSFDADGLKDIPILKIILTIIVIVAVNILKGDYETKELTLLNGRLAKLKQKEARLNADLGQKKQLEKIKSQLESDEFVMKTKIETIDKLLTGRRGSAEMLIVLSKILPENVWFSEFVVDASSVRLKGVSSEFSLISDLMRSLGNSAFLSNVKLVNSDQDVAKNGIQLARFEITAEKR